MTFQIAPPPRPYAEMGPIATRILETARKLDPNFRVFPGEDGLEQAELWAEMLANTNIHEQEAVQAVKDFYMKGDGRRSITPGDVVKWLQETPITTSPERVKTWIRQTSYATFSESIQNLSGVFIYPPDWPADLKTTEERHEYCRPFHWKWISEHMDEIVAGIYANLGDQSHKIATPVKNNQPAISQQTFQTRAIR